MAQMYPQYISVEERDENPRRCAEYLLYDRLAGQLGEKWLVSTVPR